ncbi:MAG TPA: hypothetical protein PKA55_17750 [Rhodoblastus sp.]|nr:hypothetical protein [Rhodoblastus sp.]
MSTRLQLSAMVYMMVQAVMFGVGAVLVLGTPLANTAMTLMPWVVISSALLSAPISWALAPRLRARFWRERGFRGDAISG